MSLEDEVSNAQNNTREEPLLLKKIESTPRARIQRDQPLLRVEIATFGSKNRFLEWTHILTKKMNKPSHRHLEIFISIYLLMVF